MPEARKAMSNRQAAAIYVAGVVVLLVAFAAGLSIARKSGKQDPVAAPRQTEARQSVAKPASEELQYEVIVAAVGTLQRARQIEAELKDKKYHSAHIKMPTGEYTLFRVFIGPYTRQEADSVAAELSREGMKGHMVIQAKPE
jgi:cell division septation protein DedD